MIHPVAMAACPTCQGVVADEGDGLVTAIGALVAVEALPGKRDEGYALVRWATVVDLRADPTGTVVSELRRLARTLETRGLPVASQPPLARRRNGTRQAVDATRA